MGLKSAHTGRCVSLPPKCPAFLPTTASYSCYGLLENRRLKTRSFLPTPDSPLAHFDSKALLYDPRHPHLGVGRFFVILNDKDQVSSRLCARGFTCSAGRCNDACLSCPCAILHVFCWGSVVVGLLQGAQGSLKQRSECCPRGAPKLIVSGNP